MRDEYPPLQVVAGDEVTLTCSATGGRPGATNFTWSLQEEVRGLTSLLDSAVYVYTDTMSLGLEQRELLRD